MNPAVEVGEREAGALAVDLGFDRGHVLRLPVVAMTAAGTAFGANGAAEAGWVALGRTSHKGWTRRGSSRSQVCSRARKDSAWWWRSRRLGPARMSPYASAG